MKLPSLRSFNRDLWTAAALAAGFFLVYLRTLCPTVYLGDSGEITTAVATGSIIHPPGYPLFSVLGRLALTLVPVGEPAFRIGMVVIGAAAAAVGVLYLLGREIEVSRLAAAAAAGLFGASFTFWNQSTRVEVYSLHVLLACLTLLFTLKYRRTGNLHLLGCAALAAALGIGHHLTIVLLGPAVLILLGKKFWTEPRLARRLGVPLACLMLGPALYVMLMLWSRADPLYDWSHPTTLPALWYHVSAKIYRQYLQLPTPAYLGPRLAQSWGLALDNFPSMLLLLPALGACALWRRDRAVAGGLLAAAAVVLAYDQCYRIKDIAAYFLVVWMIGAVLTGVALDLLLSRIRKPQFRTVVGALASALLVGSLVLRNWSACDLSRFVWVREFGRHKLESVDRNGVLITQGDDDVNPLKYVHDLLHVRPDVLPLDIALASGGWQDPRGDRSLWYIRHLRHRGLDLSLEIPNDPAEWRRLADDGYLLWLLDTKLQNRPLFITGMPARAGDQERPLVRMIRAQKNVLPHGIVLELQPKTRAVDLAKLARQDDALWAHIALPDLHGVRTDQEMDADYLQKQYAAMLLNFGGLHEMLGDRKRAAEIYQRVAAWAPGYQPAQAALAAIGRR